MDASDGFQLIADLMSYAVDSSARSREVKYDLKSVQITRDVVKV